APATTAASRDARRGAEIALLITAVAVLSPIVLALFGADYLAPRNLVGAMIPLSALIAVVIAASGRDPAGGAVRSPPVARAGMVLAATIALAFLAVSVDVDLSPRLQ